MVRNPTLPSSCCGFCLLGGVVVQLGQDCSLNVWCKAHLSVHLIEEVSNDLAYNLLEYTKIIRTLVITLPLSDSRKTPLSVWQSLLFLFLKMVISLAFLKSSGTSCSSQMREVKSRICARNIPRFLYLGQNLSASEILLYLSSGITSSTIDEVGVIP